MSSQSYLNPLQRAWREPAGPLVLVDRPIKEVVQ
jgi:hypothetical protein